MKKLMSKTADAIKRLLDCFVNSRFSFNYVFRDACIYGTGIWKTGKRKWYNPLRYIRGKHYRKNIRWEDVFKS